MSLPVAGGWNLMIFKRSLPTQSILSLCDCNGWSFTYNRNKRKSRRALTLEVKKKTRVEHVEARSITGTVLLAGYTWHKVMQKGFECFLLPWIWEYLIKWQLIKYMELSRLSFHESVSTEEMFADCQANSSCFNVPGYTQQKHINKRSLRDEYSNETPKQLMQQTVITFSWYKYNDFSSILSLSLCKRTN